MIKIKIDVTQIQKSRLFPGKKGTYLNAVLIETPKSKFSDYMIIEDVSKEDRDKGIKGNVLGDGKIVAGKTEDEEEHKPSDPKDKLPF